MSLVFDVTVSGTADTFDVDAAKMVVALENERRAAQDPPETPLPDSTNAELKASYLSMLVLRVSEVHEAYAKQAALRDHDKSDVRELWKNATPTQRDAAVAALTA